jgi:tetratricopeptide (TPR) repeat protein
LLLASLAAAPCVAASQQDAELAVQASVSAKRIYVGDTVTLLVEVDGADAAARVDTSAIRDFDVRSLGPPGVSQMVQIINGRRTEHRSVQFSFALTPQRAGLLTVPALPVTFGDKTASTRPLSVEVIAPEERDVARVELRASSSNPFPGQKLTIWVEVLLRRLQHDGKLLGEDPFDRRDPPQLRIPWLGGTEVLRATPQVQQVLEQGAGRRAAGFRINDLFQEMDLRPFARLGTVQRPVAFERDTIDRPGKDGTPVSYYRYRLPLEYRVARNAVQPSLAAQLRGDVFSGVRDENGELAAVLEPVVVAATPLPIRVRQLPLANRLPWFTGAVGQVQMSATVPPHPVRVGEPISLTLRVRGEGLLDEMSPPSLADQPGWQQFRVHDSPTASRASGGERVFEFQIRPTTPDVQAVPPVLLSYFDPERERYMTVKSDAIPLVVLPAGELKTTDIVDSAKSPATRELEELAAGLAANYDGPDLLADHGPYDLRANGLRAYVWGLPLLVGLAAAARWWVHRQRADAAGRRARRAMHAARRRLAAAPAGHGDRVSAEAARAVAGFITDRLDLSNGEHTPAEIRHHLSSAGVADELAAACARLLERCDQARFAGEAASSQCDALIRDAGEMLTRLDRELRPGTTPQGGRPGGARPAGEAVASAVPSALLLASMLAVSSSSCTAAKAEPPELAEARAAFQAGAAERDAAAAQRHFAAAATAYQALVDSGRTNGRLYYNLGNAQFRAGQLPQAILSYRRAQRLLPRDPQVADNLAFARSRVSDRIDPTPTNRLMQQILFLHHVTSPRERTTAALVAWGIGWLALLARLVLPRRGLVLAATGALFLAVTLTLSVGSDVRRDAQRPLGVLAARETIVRKGDGVSYEPHLNRPLGPGVEFRVIERRGGWLHIELPDAKTGWIQSDQALVE